MATTCVFVSHFRAFHTVLNPGKAMVHTCDLEVVLPWVMKHCPGTGLVLFFSGGQSTQIKYLSKSTDTYNKILLQ